MNQRRDDHPTEKSCRYDLENSCKHSDEECWYKHNNARNLQSKNILKQSNINECFECKIKF